MPSPDDLPELASHRQRAAWLRRNWRSDQPLNAEEPRPWAAPALAVLAVLVIVVLIVAVLTAVADHAP